MRMDFSTDETIRGPTGTPKLQLRALWPVSSGRPAEWSLLWALVGSWSSCATPNWLSIGMVGLEKSVLQLVNHLQAEQFDDLTVHKKWEKLIVQRAKNNDGAQNCWPFWIIATERYPSSNFQQVAGSAIQINLSISFLVTPSVVESVPHKVFNHGVLSKTNPEKRHGTYQNPETSIQQFAVFVSVVIFKGVHCYADVRSKECFLTLYLKNPCVPLEPPLPLLVLRRSQAAESIAVSDAGHTWTGRHPKPKKSQWVLQWNGRPLFHGYFS